MDQIIIYILYFIFKEKLNEKFTKEGDSPVFKNKFNYIYIKLISRTEHVEFCLNIGGPPSKSKYFLKFDSELVP